MFRSLSSQTDSFPGIKLHFPDVEICTFVIESNSAVVSKTLAELELRKKYEITLLAIKKETKTITNPPADTTLNTGDIVFVLTKHEKLLEISNLFKNKQIENKSEQ